MGKYFGTDGFRGEAGITLTADHAYKVGRFLGWYYNALRERNGDNESARIVIGKDTRRSSYMFEYSLVAGLTASGADAYLLHVTTTPSVAYIARVDDFDCGIMISASHNPYYDNGIKLIDCYGEKMPEETLLLVEDYIDGKLHVFDQDWPELPFAHREHIGCTVDYVAGRNRYMGYLISLGIYSFKGVKVGLDCANGSSWNIAKSVFDALGADTYVINNQPNGLNINNNAGSTHIEGLQKFVIEKGLDVGFAYDGDADRCLCVDEKGNVITGDHILYIYGCYMKERGKLLTNTVVTTVMSNFGLYKAFDEQGIGYAKTAVGDKYVYEYMAKNGCRIGGEQSGHIIFSKYASTGDGILTSLKMMEVMLAKKKPMSELSQQTSYEGQKSYYTKLIHEKAGWIFAGMYADEAIFGTNRNHRTEFNQMMEDAMNGKIDYIITKSISRFARNTVDTLNCVRQLRQCDPPIGVYFEKENIDTLDASGELLLTILSALAQEESNSISKNIGWSIQKKFQEGVPFGNPRSVYGYTDGKNKEWVIEEEQAKVVRFIFEEFLLGKSAYRISKELNEKGVPSPKGTKWITRSVDFILRNEKYVGDCEMQKTVTTDFLSHKTVKNTGEAPKYYVTDHHVPIIDRTTWTRTQEVLEIRSQSKKAKKGEKPTKRVGKDIFENLKCGMCGEPFYRRTLQARATHFSDERSLDACRMKLAAQGMSADDFYERYYYTYPVWRCSSLKEVSPHNSDAFMGKADPNVAWHPTYTGETIAKCPSHFVYETAIKQSFMEMLYAIKRDYLENGDDSWIASEFQTVYKKVKEHVDAKDVAQRAELEEEIRQLEEKLAQMQAKLKEATERGRSKNSPEIETYERLVADLRNRMEEKRTERLQFSQEETLLSEMKTNYDFFISCLEALTEVNAADMKLNVNGLDTNGSCLREMDGKARNKITTDIRRGKRKMNLDRVEQAPDFLEFEKGIYFAFIKEGIVDGDVITYMTNFGVKLVSTGNSRTLMAFIGFRKCNPNKTVEILMDGWQVNGLCIRYHRENKKEKTANTLAIRKKKALERKAQEA